MPTHPALVHLPLALALVVPIVALTTTLAWWRGITDRRHWLLVAALQAMLLVGGYMAAQAGEHDEETIEEIVPERAIHHHEELAERFMGTSMFVFLLIVVAGIIPKDRERIALGVAAASVAAGAYAFTLAIEVGEEGGELVYEYGGGAAFADGDAHDASEHRGHHEDDDHDDDD